MSQAQPGILDSVPAQGRHLFFDLFAGADPRPSLQALRELVEGGSAVVGLGYSLIFALDAESDGLRVLFLVSAGARRTPRPGCPRYLIPARPRL